jgi:RimJ/RimL family protein N-acetyltransferase
MEIRTLTLDDAEAYFAIRTEALDDSPRAFGASPAAFRERGIEGAAKMIEPVEGERFVVGAWLDGRLVGTVGFMRGSGKTWHGGYVWGVYVSPTARQIGLGAAMMLEAIRLMRAFEGLERATLDVDSESPGAVRLYEKMGFRSFALERNALKVGDEYVHLHHMALDFSEVD